MNPESMPEHCNRQRHRIHSLTRSWVVISRCARLSPSDGKRSCWLEWLHLIMNWLTVHSYWSSLLLGTCSLSWASSTWSLRFTLFPVSPSPRIALTPDGINPSKFENSVIWSPILKHEVFHEFRLLYLGTKSVIRSMDPICDPICKDDDRVNIELEETSGSSWESLIVCEVRRNRLCMNWYFKEMYEWCKDI